MGFWFKLRLVWLAVKAFFAVSDHPMQRQQDVFLAAIERMSDAQTRQLEAVSSALVAQATAFKAYLDMFQPPPGEGRTYVMDDRAQLELEHERLKAAGYPVGESAEFQLQWVLDHSR